VGRGDAGRRARGVERRIFVKELLMSMRRRAGRGLMMDDVDDDWEASRIECVLGGGRLGDHVSQC